MPRFSHHKYTWTKPFGSVRHNWELVGPRGGINFHFSPIKGYPPTAGLEFHHPRSANAFPDSAPHFLNCPLLGEPCWHDGTSLYATETILPEVEAYLRDGEHELIFAMLEREYDKHFKEKEKP